MFCDFPIFLLKDPLGSNFLWALQGALLVVDFNFGSAGSNFFLQFVPLFPKHTIAGSYVERPARIIVLWFSLHWTLDETKPGKAFDKISKKWKQSWKMLEILENARIFFWFSHLLTKQYLSLNWRRDRKTLLKQFASQGFLVFGEAFARNWQRAFLPSTQQ